MTRMVRRLFWMEFRSRIRNKLLLLVVVALALVYGLIFALNVVGVRSVAGDVGIHGVKDWYLKVPLREPVKTYSYFGYFVPVGNQAEGVDGTGYIFLPDRYEDPGVVTATGRLFFLVLASIMILYAYYENSEYRNGLDQSLFHTPLQKRDLFRAKLITGAMVVVLASLMQTMSAVLVMWISRLEFCFLQYEQIVLYNLMNGLMLYLIYLIALTIGFLGREPGLSLLYSLMALMIIVYLVPVVLENFRNAIFYQLSGSWKGTWYWYSRYFAILDPFGSFGTFTSELLFLGRARHFYASLPWSHGLTLNREFTIWSLIQLNWFKPLGLMLWILGIWSLAERRFNQEDGA